MKDSDVYRLSATLRFIKKHYMDKNINTALDIAGSLETSEMILKGFGCKLTLHKMNKTNSFIEKFLSQYLERINSVEGRIEDAIKELPDNTFDLVFAGEIIEHIYMIDELFDNVLRILTKGGIFVGTTPNLVAWYNRILILSGQNPVNYSPWPIGRTIFKVGHSTKKLPIYEYHVRIGNPASLIQYIEAKGFQNVKYTTTNEFGNDRRFSLFRRIAGKILLKNMRENIIFSCQKN